ncbi:Glycogen_debranching enzyme [Hexamita inflata]|uniref:Glycogen debranching enzyme n=1 Tax=Hexamita inflata TaxID=28002 RepID=A0AA86QSN0_9EUKA|nr:Glycogen debranching enzyme [Hexamita inflata]
MNTVQFDSDFHLITPKGTLFVERTADAKMKIVHQTNASYGKEIPLKLINIVSNTEQTITLLQEQFTGKFSTVIDVALLDCGLYMLVTPKDVLKFTVSPMFTNIQMCTVFTHQIHSILDQIKELPYNWLHLTPLPKSGRSKSAYSMISFDDYQLTPAQIQKLSSKNILVDCVLNHIAPESKLLESLEHSYNQINCPYLKSAIVMDLHLKVINYFAVAKKQNKDKIMTEIRHMLDTQKFYEFELFNVQGTQTQHFDLDYEQVQIPSLTRFGAELNFKYLESKGIHPNDYDQVRIQYNNFVMNRAHNEQHEIQRNLEGSVQYQLDQKSSYILTNYFCPILEKGVKENANLKFHKHIKALEQECNDYQDFLQKHGDLFKDVEDDKYIFAAVNGWVMGPAIKFIEKHHRIYPRRALIGWGDCVKLNYNPKLTELAAQYVENMAKLFQGLRIDNAHSTDNEVLKHCLQRARKVNSNLLVMCEVFTSSQDTDSQFVQEVFADMKVQEIGHSRDVQELCAFPTIHSVNSGLNVIGDFEPSENKVLVRQAPIMLYDQTHDNQPNGQNQHGYGNNLCLAVTGVASEGVGYGTTWGVDLGVRQQIQVIDQTPCYPKFKDFAMTKIKHMLLKIKEDLVNYSRVYAHNHGEFMTIERQNPASFESYVFVIVPDFRHSFTKDIRLKFEGQFQHVVFGAKMCPKTAVDHEGQKLFEQFAIQNDLGVFSQNSQLVFDLEMKMIPGTVLVFKKKVKEIAELQKYLSEKRIYIKSELSKLNLIQMKLFCAQHENEDKEYGMGKYSFHGIDPTICGFDGIRDCILRNGNSSSVAANLRQGYWLIDFMVERHIKLGLNVQEFDKLLVFIKDSVPQSFQPLAMYMAFELVDQLVDEAICEQCRWKFDPVRAKLLRAALLLIGFKADYANVDQNKWITEEFDRTVQNQLANDEPESSQSTVNALDSARKRQVRLVWKSEQQAILSPQKYLSVSVSAGFPHFFEGMFRSWGRDIALSITGILTNQFQVAARCMLVSTAALIRHGLLPNLQDNGRMPRYNCRDAVWFWISSVVQYCQKYDASILQDKVKRIFLSDDEADYVFDQDRLQFVYTPAALEKYGSDKTQTIAQVIAEILEKHLTGIHFTEWKCQDSNMKPEGKVVDAFVDENGFVQGGSVHNCHTWMDKMGSSDHFGNRGVPSTPRCGADVEINLCALFSLTYLKDHLKSEKVAQWQQKLSKNILQFKVAAGSVKYLKDTLVSAEFRPNYLIGLSFFDKAFLTQFKEEILSAFATLLEPNSIGMKTLSPADNRYCPWYNNNDQSGFETANGFSYHNGPEWVHCMGRALICLKKIGETELYEKWMRNIRRFVMNGAYINGGVKSLPELTQSNGGFCYDSCVSQNWAIASVLESME